jgi:hypothetical protein
MLGKGLGFKESGVESHARGRCSGQYLGVPQGVVVLRSDLAHLEQSRPPEAWMILPDIVEA